MTISHARLREILHYNPKTGVFTWLISPNNRFPKGSRAGRVHYKRGYREIRINRKWYRANRLAFLYMTGKWPRQNVDHKDRNRPNDDRWSNLRNANQSQNAANQKRWTNKVRNTPKGVTWHRGIGYYVARIKVNGKLIRLGLYKNAEEAHEAYKRAAKKYFGEFARFK